MPLVFLWMTLIFIASAIPDLSILHLADWINKPHHFLITDIDWSLVLSSHNPFFSIPSYDSLDTILHKIGHITVYSVLGLLMWRATRSRSKSMWLCLAYATFDELHQAFTPGRSARLLDVTLDIFCAVLCILIAKRRTAPTADKKPVLPS
ncbi:MAG TPA: VanZ family protein [Bacilli bacterium]|nr:VanZ family protein [Bacilli bacterium]